jgi:hypothetical protein
MGSNANYLLKTAQVFYTNGNTDQREKEKRAFKED